jgi:hypothetical protein
MPTEVKPGWLVAGYGPPWFIAGLTATPVGIRFAISRPTRVRSSGTSAAAAASSLPSPAR